MQTRSPPCSNFVCILASDRDNIIAGFGYPANEGTRRYVFSFSVWPAVELSEILLVRSKERVDAILSKSLCSEALNPRTFFRLSFSLPPFGIFFFFKQKTAYEIHS